MMRKSTGIALGLTLALAFGALAPVALAAENGSLWPVRSSLGSLFEDHRAHQVGDLLTVIIVEKAEAAQKASTSSGKDGSVGIGPGLGFLKALPEIKAKGSEDMGASGATTRGGSLNAKITVVVKEVRPNGTMLVEGSQFISVNKEEQKIVLAGVVRQEDVARDNTVYSTYLADARITYLGDGVVGEKQKPGLLSRIFGWLL
jgi:flagellar L-ring protein precursor FlgH